MIVATGRWGVVEWGRDARGRFPALVAFEALPASQAARVLARIERFAESGRLADPRQFKALGPMRDYRLWEFKVGDIRLIGTFGLGARFVIAHLVRKKQARLRLRDLENAASVRRQHFGHGDLTR